MVRWMSGRSVPVLPEMLPPLRGWWLKFYTAAWIAVMAIAIAVTGLNTWQGAKPVEYGWLNYGLSADSSGEHIAIVIGAEAIAQGIEHGDAILAIDGVPLAEIGMDYLAAHKALARPEGAMLALTLRDAQGQVRTHRLTRSAANTRASERTRLLEVAIGLLSNVAFLCAAALLFRRRREPVPAILALAFVLTLVGPTWQAGIWLKQPVLTEGLGMLSTFGYPLMFFGLLVFPDGRMGSRMAWAIAGVIAIWTAFNLTNPFGLADAVYIPAFLALLAVAVVRQALRYRRMPPGGKRQQIRWGIFGFVSGSVWVMLSGGVYVAGERIGGAAYWNFSAASGIIGLLGALCMVGGLLISLMRYRLYDADAVIGRSAAYGVLTLGFIALFAGGEEAIEALGESYLGGQVGALAGALAAALAAMLIVPLHGRVSAWAERRFQKALLRLRHGLPRLVGDLRETAPPDRIADAVAGAAMGAVHASRAAVVIGDAVAAAHGVSAECTIDWLTETDIEAESAKQARRDPLFPMRLALDTEGTGRVGWLLLGPRPDGSFYGKDEREALADIAGPVARALAVAGTRDRREREMLELIGALQARIAALEGAGSERRGGSPTLATAS